MQCHDARILLLFGHKSGEFAAEDAAALERHLHDCEPCRLQAQSNQRMDAALARAMNAVPLPDGLQTRLLGEVRRRARLRRRWLNTAAALAAAILIAVGLGSYLWLNQPIPTSLQVIGEELSARSQRNKTKVDEWFVQHADVQAPTILKSKVGGRDFDWNLDYTLLNIFGHAKLQGVDVPHLVFISERNSAVLHIFVLSDRQFDLANLDTSAVKPEYHGNFTVELLKSANSRYLVAYTSGNLQPFCTPVPPPH